MTANNYQWFLTSIVDYNRCRTFGFYHEYTDALDAVMTNKCNMEESLYEYLVMEKIAEGIHPEVLEEYWFKWKNSNWISCKKPYHCSLLTNWALG